MSRTLILLHVLSVIYFYRVTHSCYLPVSKKMKQMSFVALFHGLSFHFLSFISSPLSLRLIDGQWLLVWSLLMSLIFQPHQSVNVPFKSHQMRWEPWELRCAGHWDIGSGLIPPQRTHIEAHTHKYTHVQRHTGLALKWIQVGKMIFFQGLDIVLATVRDWTRKEEMTQFESLTDFIHLSEPLKTLLRLTRRIGRRNRDERVVSRFLETHRTCHITGYMEAR